MLDTLITSKTRIKLLMKLFLNPANTTYLRSLAEELGESTNSVRVELNRLEEAGLLEAKSEGRTKQFRANTNHPLFSDIQNIIRKSLGIDQLIDTVLENLGSVRLAFITGDYAKGIDSGIIDLIVVGEVNEDYLNELVKIAEGKISRRIRTLVLSEEEAESYGKKFSKEKILPIWKSKE